MPKFDANSGRYLGIGLEMLVGALLGYFVGHLLDKRYGWQWAAVTGAMLGVSAGLYALIRSAIRMNKD